MTYKFLIPIASSLVLLGSIPVLAASHTKTHGPGQHGNSSHTVVLPRQAAATAHTAVSGKVPLGQGNASNQATVSTSASMISMTTGPQHGNKRKNSSGQPIAVNTAVAEIHTLRTQIQGARLKYVAAIKTYIRTLATTMASGQSGSLQTALSQLKSINQTLAQTVKTEMTAKAVQTSGTGSHGPSQVVTKFKAELAALTAATKEVQSLTTILTSTASTSTSTSSTSSGSTGN